MAIIALENLLVYSNETFLLVALIFLLYAVRFYLQPVPIAHPLLLGRQADVSKVRYLGETATYRNYGVGHGAILPARPRKEVVAAHNVLQTDFLQERTLWKTRITNEKLRLRIQALGTGLVRHAGLMPENSTTLILLSDSFEWILTDLTLSAFSIPSITITKLNLLASVLELHRPSAIVTDATFIGALLEHIAEEEEYHHTAIIVVGDETGAQTAKGRKAGFKIFTMEEVEEAGIAATEPVALKTPQGSDLFTTTYYDQTNDTPIGVRLTHQNLTAGPTSMRQFFTVTTPLSGSSTVLSAFGLATPFGRAVAYTALLEGSSFATVESTAILKGLAPQRTAAQNMDEIVRATSVQGFPRPTHLFITPQHLESLTQTIISHASASTFGGWAWSRKLVELASGALAENTLWDRIGGLKEGRRLALGWSGDEAWVKSVVVAGGPSPELTFPTARLALSIPLINAHIEPLSTGPILASHPFDLQHFPPAEEDGDDLVAHVGPPGANVEVKLVATGGKDSWVDDSRAGAVDPVGKLFYRGPSVGERVPPQVAVPTGKQAPLQGNGKGSDSGWIDSGRMGRVHSNGTFRIVSDPSDDLRGFGL